MIVGRRSFSFGSQYLSENVTSDSDTWPSESHALIISLPQLTAAIKSPLELKLLCSTRKKGNHCTSALNADSADREPLSPARRVRLDRAAHQSRDWQRRAYLSHLPR